jgi:hypothetical protein
MRRLESRCRIISPGKSGNATADRVDATRSRQAIVDVDAVAQRASARLRRRALDRLERAWNTG